MNKKAKISAIERDERAIQLPLRLPLGKALAGLKATILEAIQEGNYALIDAFCRAKLLPLLEAQSELAYLKGGRRAELSAEKVVRESAVEFAPVKFSLGDDSDAQARGTIEYLRRISGIDPSKARSKFKRHIVGAIGDLSKEITSEVKKAVEDLTKQGIHLRGGKARIQEILARHNVQVTNTPALAETLFRTQSQQAYAAGRWNTVNDSDFGDYIWGFEYVTAGDDRVREGHRVLEGVRLPKEDPFWKKYFPPNGWNCRCTTLEIWKDEPTAKIDFGITGRDPRKRTPGAMNVPAEFRGNVGIFAAATPKKSEKKKPAPVREVAKKISTRIVPENKTSNQSRDSGKMAPDKRLQEEIRKVIQVLAARYGSEVMIHLQLIPSGNTCRVLWNGTLIETIKVFEGNDTHFSFSNEPKRKYKIKGKKPFSTLLGAVSDVLHSKIDNVESVDDNTLAVGDEELLGHLVGSKFSGVKQAQYFSVYRESLFEKPKEKYSTENKKIIRKKQKSEKENELPILNYLLNTNNEVLLQKNQQDAHYDALVNGSQKVEFKRIRGDDPQRPIARIGDAIEQGAEIVIVDIRIREIAQEDADEIVKRVIDKYGAPLKIDIIIWTRRVIGGQETLVQYVYIKEKDNGGT